MIIEKGYQKFTQLLCYKVLEVMKVYKRDLPEYVNWFPEKFAFEELRIKKYEPGSDDQFELHVDVQDHMSAKRYHAFLVYLNDDFKGGETTFPFIDEEFCPSEGKAIIWCNLNPDMSRNNFSMHHAKQVRKGYKAIITKWFRTGIPGTS